MHRPVAAVRARICDHTQGGDDTVTAQPYHHGNLAAALIDAGVELAAEGGPDAVVLREVARRVGVSPTAAYRHFDGQAGLTNAVKEASLGRLAEHMRRALDDHARRCRDVQELAEVGSPARELVGAGGPALVPLPGIDSGSPQEHAIRRLEAIGRAYVDFALTEPGLFRCFCIGMPVPGAMSGPAGVRAPDLVQPEAEFDHDDDAFGVLAEVLGELVTAGVLTADRRAAHVDIALWATVHGFAVLCLDGPLSELPRAAQDEMLMTVLDVAFYGLLGSRQR